MKDTIDLLREGVKNRFQDTILSTFIVSFLVTNYDLLIVLFEDDFSIYQKVDYIRSSLSIFGSLRFDSFDAHGIYAFKKVKGWHILRLAFPVFVTWFLLYKWPNWVLEKLKIVTALRVKVQNSQHDEKIRLNTIDKEITKRVFEKTEELTSTIGELKGQLKEMEKQKEGLSANFIEIQKSRDNLLGVEGELLVLNKDLSVSKELVERKEETIQDLREKVGGLEAKAKDYENLTTKFKNLEEKFSDVNYAYSKLVDFAHRKLEVKESSKLKFTNTLNKLEDSEFYVLDNSIVNELENGFNEGLTSLVLDRRIDYQKRRALNFKEVAARYGINFNFVVSGNTVFLVDVKWSEFIEFYNKDKDILSIIESV